MFKTWAEAETEELGVTRYTHCIYCDTEVVQSVLNGDQPGSTGPSEIAHPTAFVKVIDAEWETEADQVTADQVPDDVLRERLNSGDEGYPPVLGCRREDVGWMKVAARNLIPRMYYGLMNGEWDMWYVRPPGIQFD
jgi:hypothetical protein